MVQLRYSEICTLMVHLFLLYLSTLPSMGNLTGNKMLALYLLTYIKIAAGASILHSLHGQTGAADSEVLCL